MCVINGANCWQFVSSMTFRFIKFNFIVDTGDITDRLVNNDLYIFLTGDKYPSPCFLQFCSVPTVQVTVQGCSSLCFLVAEERKVKNSLKNKLCILKL